MSPREGLLIFVVIHRHDLNVYWHNLVLCIFCVESHTSSRRSSCKGTPIRMPSNLRAGLDVRFQTSCQTINGFDQKRRLCRERVHMNETVRARHSKVGPTGIVRQVLYWLFLLAESNDLVHVLDFDNLDGQLAGPY